MHILLQPILKKDLGTFTEKLGSLRYPPYNEKTMNLLRTLFVNRQPVLITISIYTMDPFQIPPQSRMDQVSVGVWCRGRRGGCRNLPWLHFMTQTQKTTAVKLFLPPTHNQKCIYNENITLSPHQHTVIHLCSAHICVGMLRVVSRSSVDTVPVVSWSARGTVTLRISSWQPVMNETDLGGNVLRVLCLDQMLCAHLDIIVVQAFFFGLITDTCK